MGGGCLIKVDCIPGFPDFWRIFPLKISFVDFSNVWGTTLIVHLVPGKSIKTTGV